MALRDPSSSRFSQSSTVVLDHLEKNSRREEGDFSEQRRNSETITVTDNGGNEDTRTRIRMVFLPQNVVLCDVWHEEFEASAPLDSRVVLNWRPKERTKTGCAALVLCLNIGVDPPDVIKVSPCARMECWIDPFSTAAEKALEQIGKTLQAQYERWQHRVHYKLQLDPTVDRVKKLCNICRINAKSERVLFHYNGHGVPKPTANGEIWVFNASHTQYIPLPISDLDSWLKTPSIYVFDCSAAGMIVRAFIELQEWNASGSSASSTKDFILLAACEAHECLPQNVDFPADMFTSCLTTPIKMALRWFCSRSLLRDTLDYSLVDKIPGHQNDRATLMGELNWIFTAVTDTIAWNVLPPDLFQRLFKQDLLVASLFRNFLLAERIMRSANCSPISYPMLPATHQHHMWDAWDMAAETSLQSWFREPQAEFKPSSFFSEQLGAFKLWLDRGSQHKKPPEQLPIVLWVLLSRCHRYEALVLLGRFLDMGPWAVNLALSAGIIPYVLKLLKTSDSDLRQILVFIWTKVLALDKACQVDLVKDRGHIYFINFLGSIDAYPEERAMAAFVLTVIVDRHKLGQEACVNSDLIRLSLRHLQLTIPNDVHSEPLLLQWLCLCLGKLWEDFPEAQVIGLLADAPKIFAPLLSESQPEVRASAVFAMGNLLGVGSASSRDGDEVDEDCVDDQKLKDEMDIVKNLLTAVLDGSLLVRVEVVVALARFAFGHNKHLKLAAAVSSGKLQSNYVRRPFPSLPNLLRSSIYGYNNTKHYMQHGDTVHSQIGPSFKVGSDNMVMGHYRSVFSSPAATGIMHGSPLSDDSSLYSDSGILKSSASSQVYGYSRMKPLDSGLFYQCVLALCSLARDPSPHVGALGKQILAGIGIDHEVTNTLWFSGSSDQLGDPKGLLRISNRAGLARSPSWFDMGAGQLPLKLGIPVSPSQQHHFAGMQRVCSRPHLPKSLDSGLSDLLLSSAESSHVTKHSLLSQSAIYNWSCRHFSRSLLTTTDDDEEILTRREERENFALDCMTKWQHSSTNKLNKQIWESKFYTHTKTALMEPFSPVVIVADETETIRIWNYEEAVILNSFDNHNFSDEGISKLCLVNELDDSLLLIASCDGNVRIWKDYSLKGEQKLVTAFSSIQGHRSGMRHVNAVVDWQQQSGYLYASGEISSIVLWDMDKEQHVKSIPLSSECGISALSASQVHGGQLAAGFVDGSVRLYDIRTPEMIVCSKQPHSVERVVGIGFQPGLDSLKIVSASQAGDIRFLDIRNYSDPYLTIDTQSGSLSAFAIHRHAPIFASGLAKSLIEIFNLEGEQLDTISYNLSFMAQKTRSVSCLSFHPYQALLAAGTTDAGLSIYAD